MIEVGNHMRLDLSFWKMKFQMVSYVLVEFPVVVENRYHDTVTM